MFVVIKLAADETSIADDSIPIEPAPEVQDAVKVTAGSDLRPMSSAGALRTYYWVDVPDQEEAGRLAERLRGLAGVEAAYVKPPDESP